MIICGVSMDSCNASLCLLESNSTDFEVIMTKQKKISLCDDTDQACVKEFHRAFCDFVKTNKVEKVAVKARQQKGKFAGGPVSFKMEALIQMSECDVRVIPARLIAKKTKDIQVPDLLFKYQVEAFKAACAAME